MLKKKLMAKLVTILVFSLLYTSCGLSSTSGRSDNQASQQAKAPAEANGSQITSMKFSESLSISDQAMAAEQPQPQVYNTEEYGAYEERGFVSPLSEPLSTFSIDVDTASYANIRRFITNGEQVPKDAVRIEEMINYFSYDYPQPEGEVPFSVYTEISQSPWQKENKLLMIGLQGKEIEMEAIPPSNLVFLIDVSGSMQDANKLPLVKQAFLMLTENLRPGDRISIVTYAGSESVLLNGVEGNQKIEISEAIQNLDAGGSTAGARGIETAYEIAQSHFIEGGNNRVILATDGDFNVGISSEGELTQLIEDKRKNGVYLSVLGFGTGNIKDNKMEALADNGNGNYAYIDSALEAKKVFVEEMGGTLFTIAKDVKLQIEFNPTKIKGYRLIGYENRMLNAEDFENDAKDAGEMGAGHRVTALYEIIPAGSDQEVQENNLKYHEKQSGLSNEWLNIQIRYKHPDENESQLLTCPIDDTYYHETMSENLAFASSVAEFGLLLRESAYKGNANYENIYGRIINLSGTRNDVYKAEFLNMVKAFVE